MQDAIEALNDVDDDDKSDAAYSDFDDTFIEKDSVNDIENLYLPKSFKKPELLDKLRLAFVCFFCFFFLKRFKEKFWLFVKGKIWSILLRNENQ